MMAEKPTYEELEKRIQELEQVESERKNTGQWKALNIKILNKINKPEAWKGCIEEILSEIKQFTGFDAVAIRLLEDEDFPYYVTKGFPEHFVEAERYLCTRNSKGEIKRDSKGNPYVECMCGNVICGRTDVSKDFFTEDGSFWSNNTSKLLSETTDEDRKTRTRNRCNSEGYESVALFPLRAGREILGLLQINDKRPNQFTDDTIKFFEDIGISIGTAFSRKQAKEALRKSEAKFRSLFESINDSVFVHLLTEDNLPGRFIEVNEMACKKLGYSRQKFLQLTPHDISAPDDGINPLEIRDKLLNHGHTLFETIHSTKEGYRIPVESHIRLFDFDGRRAVLSIARDITERKQAEQKLKDNEIKFRAIFDDINDGILVGDVATKKLVLANNVICDMLGYTKGEILKLSVQDIHPEEALPLISEAFEKQHKKEIRVAENLPVKRKDGTVFYADINSSPITIGTATYLVGIFRDITERNKTQQDLRESKGQFQKIFNSQLDAIFILDTNQPANIIDCNNAATEIFGYDRDEIINARVNKLHINESYVKKFKAMLFSTIKKYGFLKSTHFSMKRKDGTFFPTENSVSAMNNDMGEITGWIYIIRDRSEQKRLESHLQQAQKMESIGTLAGGIAHDFNNILFPIIGYTEMLLEDFPEKSPLQDSLNKIHTACLRAKYLIQQILTFARKENSEAQLMKVQPIIKEALKLIRSTIPTTIDIKQDIHPGCGIVKADPTQIHQIIMNLATNANHAMEETGGKLKVSLKEVEFGKYDLVSLDMEPGAYVCLTVADTGKGMDKDLIQKIFDPFFTTKEKGRGTGMGLSVVHGIVTGMGGVINVYSEPDKGTEFHVYLPLAEAVKEQQVTHAKTLIQGGTEHILFVDDEKNIVEMEQKMLGRLGYQVTSRTSSIEALELFRANPGRFDLVITDMAMPNMSGDKLSAELLKIRPATPVLLCTGFSETMSEEKAASLGIKGFLLKPIVIKDLSKKIREVLDKNKVEKTN